MGHYRRQYNRWPIWKKVAAWIGVAYLGLVAIHIYQTRWIGNSFLMPLSDVSVIVACPTEFYAQWRFINRTPLESLFIGMQLEGGDSWKEICEQYVAEGLRSKGSTLPRSR